MSNKFIVFGLLVLAGVWLAHQIQFKNQYENVHDNSQFPLL